MNLQMTKSLEHTFDLLIAVSSTFLQVSFLNTYFGSDPIFVYSKIAVFVGSFLFFGKQLQNTQMTFQGAFWPALMGYSFGIYAGPALCEILGIESVSKVYLFTHALVGFASMGFLDVVYQLLQKDAYPAAQKILSMVVKAIGSWLTKSKDNDTDNTDSTGQNQPG
jgi:hypothetical protein